MNINKISFTIFMLLFNVLMLSAQDVDTKYLAGAVPLVNGKVQFEREVKVNSAVSKSQLFDLVEKWMKEEFAEVEDSNQRILLSDKSKDYLVAQGDENLVFKSQILMLDQARMTYQIVVRVEAGMCKIEVRNIRYDYQDYKKPMPAEEMITDKVALHKNGKRLNRHYDKFRTFTIDRVDELKSNLTASLGKTSVDDIKAVVEPTIVSIVEVEDTKTVATPTESIPATPLVSGTSVASEMVGYRAMKASDLSSSILKMFKDSRAVVTVGSGKDAQILTATWSGIGNFGGKQTAMTFVNSDGKAITKDAVYTISFFTEIHGDALDKLEKASAANRIATEDLTVVKTGADNTTFNEAWIVIECKMTMEQDSNESAVSENAQSKKWNKTSNPKLLMGEIQNIWAR